MSDHINMEIHSFIDERMISVGAGSDRILNERTAKAGGQAFEAMLGQKKASRWTFEVMH